jgi:hypothetical protein
LTNTGDIVYGEVEIFIQKNLISCLEKSHKTKSKRRPWDHKSKTAELGATHEEFAQVFFIKMMYHGSNYCGLNIISMGKYRGKLSKVHFGGKVYLSC